MSEDKLQSECFQWAWNTYPQTRRLLWAVPNGGSRHPLEAMKLKSTGVVKGVHDMHFFWNKRFFTFELKVGVNKLSAEQAEWQRLVEKHGAICYEIRNFDMFKDIFSNLVLL
jgi:hypothetical protein